MKYKYRMEKLSLKTKFSIQFLTFTISLCNFNEKSKYFIQEIFQDLKLVTSN